MVDGYGNESGGNVAGDSGNEGNGDGGDHGGGGSAMDMALMV